jgi:hypothetical protein
MVAHVKSAPLKRAFGAWEIFGGGYLGLPAQAMLNPAFGRKQWPEAVAGSSGRKQRMEAADGSTRWLVEA